MSDWYNQGRGAELASTQIQESKVNEETMELPAVSKLREAFDTARNAIIEGTELAKQVQEMKANVATLGSDVASLQRDVEYLRNRNRELDEQVIEVRRQRDEAVSKANEQQDRAVRAEGDLASTQSRVESLQASLSRVHDSLDEAKKARDDAEFRVMDLEDKLKAAEAKLDKLKVMFGEAFGEPKGEPVQEASKPVPHYLVQPRDEETKQFRSFDEGKTYDNGSQGSY